MSTDVALPPGYALSEYRIESLLGMGGFGLTYLATDTNLNLKVAIKNIARTCGDEISDTQPILDARLRLMRITAAAGSMG